MASSSSSLQDFKQQCLDRLVQDFEGQREMNEEREGCKARISGIFGLAGVGKTTLAKELFNRKRPSFDRSCFLFDVREASVRSDLPSLQMQLLKNLFNENDHPRFSDIEDGKSYLSSRFASSNRSFLIVLDNVDEQTQLDALLFSDEINRTGDHSLVIVTTRDAAVLINADIRFRYHMREMDRSDGNELFCWHAFGQPEPLSGYENLVDRFVDACGGLPLSLAVLGGQVHGKGKEYWQLERLSRVLPRDIQTVQN